MNAEQIMSAVRSLAASQGFYGRLLEELKNNNELMNEMVSQQFGDVVDMVMWLEC